MSSESKYGLLQVKHLSWAQSLQLGKGHSTQDLSSFV